jgi:predicted GNAT family acetyltransferase
LSDDIEVRKAPERHRFEIFVAGEQVGHAAYRDEVDRRVIPHTEIDPAREGQGLGGKLVQATLDATRDEGLLVVPDCPFVAAFIERNQEYADLVA